MKSRHFTYTSVQEPDPAGLEEGGYIPLEAIVFTNFLKRDGTLKNDCGPYMAFYPGHEPPGDVIKSIMAACDKHHEKRKRTTRKQTKRCLDCGSPDPDNVHTKECPQS